ncbi:hypothetical protein [Salegentibacter sp. F14]
MNNVLKVVLLVVGLSLIVYGFYTLITPEVSVDAGPFQFEAQGDKTQPIAMIAFGILALLGGLAYKKR